MATVIEPHQATIDQEQEPLNERVAASDTAPVILAGTTEGLWKIGEDRQLELAGHAITALVPGAEGLWAIVDRTSLWYQPWQGQWQSVATVKNLWLNCLLTVGNTLLIGTSEAHLLHLIDGQLHQVEGFNQIEQRQEWYTPWDGPPDVRSLALGSSGEWYVNIHVGGILRSMDEGKTWQSTIDFNADVHEVRTMPQRPGWVAAACAEGLVISRDQGETWTFDPTNLHAAYARAIAIGQNTLLISSSTGPHGAKAAVYRRSLDQKGTFQKCEQGLPEWFSSNIDTGCLDAWDNWATFGTREGQIFLSDDAGLTWREFVSNLAPIQSLRFVSRDL